MYEIPQLGKPTIPSPLISGVGLFVDEKRFVPLDRFVDVSASSAEGFEVAGPRNKIFFDPPETRAAVVTCGGLSPGLNEVVRALTMELHYQYGVKTFYGIRYGFQGLVPSYGHEPMLLTPEVVKDFHQVGGSRLASSRGNQDIGVMVDRLEEMNVNILFCIGGDGTMKATELIANEAIRRDIRLSVIGIPKTIDNDISTIEKTFGFDTAISEASRVIGCAHVEAKGAPNGIGLVKIMGRTSGHIALNAALANHDVNFVLIPENPFDIHGEKGFLTVLERRIRSRHHAVIVVAEGAGQEHRPPGEPSGTDASGNVRLFDIGRFLKQEIEDYFNSKDMEINLKYFDPSYIIRSVKANAADSIYCMLLAQNAVHAGMAGKTAMVVGLYDGHQVHIPVSKVTSRKKVDIDGPLWRAALAATGQPPSMRND